MKTLSAAIAALVLSVPGSVMAGAPAKKVAAPTDWAKVVVDTDTGWRMGRPDAPTKLVEYGSFNCSHCAAFAKAAMPAIRDLVAAGKISFEFRPKQIFPHDPAATLLAHCVGKANVFAFTDDYMASAPDVLARLRTAYKVDRAGIDAAEAGGTAKSGPVFSRLGEMAAIANRHGVSADRADRCLGDAALIARVDANEAAAVAAGVRSTPTFFIDGEPADIDALAAIGIPVEH